MKLAQRNLIDEVVLPKLVQMAIDGKLPSDISQLSSYDFDDEIEKHNNTQLLDTELTEEMIENAWTNYVSMDYPEVGRVLKEIYNDSNIKDSDIIDFVHDDFQIAQAFETTFTVKGFFDQLRN